LVFCSLIRNFAPAKVQKMIETLLISTLIIAIAMVFFLVRVIFVRQGEFKSQHIHDSQAMKDRGIHCVMDQDREMRRKSEYAVSEK
jgi:hypothetical protein